MANEKISELSQVTTLPDAALLTAVDLTRSSGDRNVSIEKSDFVSDFVGDLEGAVTADTGTVIVLDTVIGRNSNFLSANTNTAFTLDNSLDLTNAWNQVLINTATEPTVTGATQEGGVAWTTATNLYLVVRNTGTGVIYFYSSLAVGSGGGATPTLQPVTTEGCKYRCKQPLLLH